MCNECKKESVGTTPCKECVILADARENKFSLGDVLAVMSIVAVAYLWAIVGQVVKMIKKVILLALLCSILSGCFKDKENWETVKLYQVGQDWLFDCSSGCYRLYDILQFD